MLETHSSQQSVLYDDRDQSSDLSYFIAVLKRRILFFAIPFLVVIILGIVFIKSQRSVYRAEGELLVESPQIAPDLEHFTIKEFAEERFEIFRQRILAASNLMAMVEKYNLFPDERQSQSTFQILGLMRSRVQLKSLPPAANSPSIAFVLSFNYEVPDLALKVTNDFLTQILSEDASSRTNSATETTKILENEVRRLKDEHDAVVAQIAAIKQKRPDPQQVISEEAKAQIKALADLKADLVEKSSVYSSEHPVVRDLKKKIAALKNMIAAAPPQIASTNDETGKPDVTTAVLMQQQADLQRSLEDANHKLTAARLGESMERNQQAQHLQIIQYPELPHKPAAPKKLQWLAITFALAGMIGAGAVFAAEKLDGSIRSSRELAGIVDRHLIVTIPYLFAPGEERRKQFTFILLCTALVAIFAVVVIASASIKRSSINSAWINQLHVLIQLGARL